MPCRVLEDEIEQLRDQLRETVDENGRLYKLLKERDFEIKHLKKQIEENRLAFTGSSPIDATIPALNPRCPEVQAQLPWSLPGRANGKFQRAGSQERVPRVRCGHAAQSPERAEKESRLKRPTRQEVGAQEQQAGSAASAGDSAGTLITEVLRGACCIFSGPAGSISSGYTGSDVVL